MVIRISPAELREKVKKAKDDSGNGIKILCQAEQEIAIMQKIVYEFGVSNHDAWARENKYSLERKYELLRKSKHGLLFHYSGRLSYEHFMFGYSDEIYRVLPCEHEEFE